MELDSIKNILLSDSSNSECDFKIKFCEKYLIDLLCKISKKKIVYPYVKIKKFVLKSQNENINQKTLKTINLMQEKYLPLIFDYFKFDVIFYNNEFNYHESPESKKMILIVKLNQKNKFACLELNETHFWKKNKIPIRLLFFLDTEKYFLEIFKKINLNFRKLNFIDIVYKIEEYLNKKLSANELNVLSKIIVPFVLKK